jgi:DNA-binding transcriptional MerR regulator
VSKNKRLTANLNYDTYVVSGIKFQSQREEIMQKLFSKGQVAELLDITPRTVSHYTEQGVVIPEIGPGESRKNRKYSADNLFEFMLAQEFGKNGFNLKTVKDLLPMLKGVKMIGPGKEVLVVYDGHTDHGKAVLTAADKNQMYKVKMDGHSSAVIIDVTDIRKKWEKIIS